ncbi:MAG: hypothetical protein WBP82_06635 [Leuconostoc mesenteroides]
MTEPVAYMWKTVRGTIVGLTLADDKNPHDGHATPLYTADQLQSKIQLTNSEYELLAKVCRGISPFNKIESNIEIFPDMKWFVRSKEKDNDSDYAFLSGSNLEDLEYFGFDYARAFDTKEQAEKWLNPLTEAVQLAVE